MASRAAVAIGLLALLALAAAPLRAQEPPPSPPTAAAQAPSSDGTRLGHATRFLAGGALAFGAHEGGHVLFGRLFGLKTGVRKVDFAGVPFFAITHEGRPSRRQQFALSSAGFWMQHATSETLLSLRPHVRAADAPLLDGVLAFDILASVAYAGSAFAKYGPAERDTRTMAATLRVSERWIGALVLVPALLDAYRYFHPGASWAAWTSRGVKVGSVLLVLR